jgi:hypothetical protein
MNCNYQGNLAESVALNYFIKEGYEVYTPFGTALSCDMVVFKNGISQRVSVKSGSRLSKNGKKYEINIRQQTRSGSISFNKESCDILFLYATPINKFKIIESKIVKNRNIITI